jgi:hypothetical protein
MVSVGVTWTGKCLPDEQDELLWFIGRLADKNDELLKLSPPPVDEFASGFDPEFMTPQRQQNLRSRSNVERVDCAISEKLEIDSSVLWDYREFDDGARQLGLPIIGARGPDAEEGPSVLNLLASSSRRVVRLNHASIYGINFKVFGAGYPWYPGEDRVSFVFLHCPEILFLDGRIVEMFHRTDSPGLIRFDTVHEANWYGRAPEMHLRYYLEEWFDYFFSWVKFYFVPNFHWWRHDSLPNYDRHRSEFEELQAKVGGSVAKSASFDDIMHAFVTEASTRQTTTGVLAGGPSTSGSGLHGRVLRALRQSDDSDA